MGLGVSLAASSLHRRALVSLPAGSRYVSLCWVSAGPFCLRSHLAYPSDACPRGIAVPLRGFPRLDSRWLFSGLRCRRPPALVARWVCTFLHDVFGPARSAPCGLVLSFLGPRAFALAVCWTPIGVSPAPHHSVIIEWLWGLRVG